MSIPASVGVQWRISPPMQALITPCPLVVVENPMPVPAS